MSRPLRSPWSADRIFATFLVASLPAAVVGNGHLGAALLQRLHPDLGLATLGWRGSMFDALGVNPQHATWSAELLMGASYFLPLLVVALAVAWGWQVVFRRSRGQSRDLGWVSNAWLFVLLLPTNVSPLYAGLAMSFGMLVGVHIFGGTGRYLVSPALLGALFLHFSYPGLTQSALPAPFADAGSSWMQLMANPNADAGVLWAYALGQELGAFGTGSALACALGAAYLVYAGSVSWRTIAGGVAGVLVVATLSAWMTADNAAATLPWYAHFAVGNLAFVLAFIATDPSMAPLTRSGRWLYGAVLGALTIIMRVLDPHHPESALFAALLAALSVPLLDYLVLRRYSARTVRPAS
jgi:Na+-transporting NADH:ubiquinone oxidoreductase subunit B